MGEEKQYAFVIIPKEASNGSGFAAKWVNDVKLSLYPQRDNVQTLEEIEGDNIVHLKPKFVLDEPIIRSLVVEASTIFQKVQEAKKSGSRANYVELSRTYRSVIRACLEKMTNEDQEKYNNFITVFYSIECIWHLCEILILDSSPTYLVVPQLLEWIRFHFPRADRRAADLLLCGTDADENPDYWQIIKELVLNGQVNVARTLLQMSSSCETNAFKMMEHMLKTMPIYSPFKGIPVQKFKMEWRFWQNETKSKLKSGILSSEPELEEIGQFITGNDTFWEELLKNSSCWYEYFPGYLFYTDPTCKFVELEAISSNWQEIWLKAGDRFLSALDYLITSLMKNEIIEFLPDIQMMEDNKWFVTHLIDLLYNSGKLLLIDDHTYSLAGSIRDTFMYEFGVSLISEKSLWMIGLDYLECCIEGRGTMERLLTRIPIDNEKQAQKIIYIARRKNLPSVEKEICRIQARKAFTNERYGSALEWAIRSKDNLLISSISDHYLHHYVEHKEILCPDMLASVGPRATLSARLGFLVAFFEFTELFESQEYEEATKLLMKLFQSKRTPEYFCPSLLLNAVLLIKCGSITLSSQDVYTILDYLETELVPLVEKKGKGVINLKNFNYDLKFDDPVRSIRLICAETLSDSIIIENDADL